MDQRSQIVFRHCEGLEEYAACVRLQGEVWGYDGDDIIPKREFVVIKKIGGQVIGAFDPALSDGPAGMIGFAMSMPAIEDGKPYLHSHMLAVEPGYRNQGVGRRLKLAQREDALKRGILRMDWTFDPLEIKNAWLNIGKLGVVVHRYWPNIYGVFSSRLQGGLPTDRLQAEWWMDSRRVRATLDGETVNAGELQETITVPAEIRDWRSSSQDLQKAIAAQAEIRERFQSAFARGLAVVGLNRAQRPDGAIDGIFQLAIWRGPFTL